jgi:sn-glycerol 3-phosphate transport system ATP-binding protein
MGVTSLYVTHDQVEAMTLGDRLLVLHQGIAVQLATPMEVFERPANIFVAGFIGTPAMNFLSATLVRDGTAARLADGTEFPFADGPRPGADGRELTLGIRPEHLVPAAQGLVFHVDLVEPLGSETVLIGRLADDTPASVKLPGPAPETTSLVLAPQIPQLHVFDRASGVRLDPAATAV